MLDQLRHRLKSPDSLVSLILGLAVVFVIGTLSYNYFSKRPGNIADQAGGDTVAELSTPPTTHTVTAGETLWTIAEKYYQNGFNWVDIRDANTLADPNNLEVGQTISIPVVSVADTTAGEVSTTSTEVTPETTVAVETTMALEATMAPEATVAPEAAPETTPGTQPNSYTVVHGDTLWSIAKRFYNDDGYQWVNIAQANSLVNPDLIHPGNVLTLP